MRILALETAGIAGSVALLEGASLLAERDLPSGRRTAQTLAPTISAMLEQQQWSPESLGLVVVTVGPGSFTGLRIGVMAAKVFSYATGAQVLGVGTLAVIAHQVVPGSVPLWTAIPAERGQLFAARFEPVGEHWQETQPAEIVDPEPWLAGLPPCWLAGEGLRPWLATLPPGATAVEESAWLPRASTVGRLGWREHQAGRRSDCFSLLPSYIRPSAATEKAEG